MNFEINDLSKYKHIHLIGIGGISMSSLAKLLHRLGYPVSGSDLACNGQGPQNLLKKFLYKRRKR